MADYQIILNAAGWHEKGVLTEDDLSEINNAIESYIPEKEKEEKKLAEEIERLEKQLARKKDKLNFHL